MGREAVAARRVRNALRRGHPACRRRAMKPHAAAPPPAPSPSPRPERDRPQPDVPDERDPDAPNDEGDVEIRRATRAKSDPSYVHEYGTPQK